MRVKNAKGTAVPRRRNRNKLAGCAGVLCLGLQVACSVYGCDQVASDRWRLL